MKVHSGILTKARTTCTGRAAEMSEVPSSLRAWADQRTAIVEGLRDLVDEVQRSVPGTTSKDVMNLVLMTQYFDTLKEIGASSRSNTIMIPHLPGSLTSLSDTLLGTLRDTQIPLFLTQ